MLCAAQPTWLTPDVEPAYEFALNLNTERANVLIQKPESPQQLYVASLANVLELLITEDETRFAQYESEFTSRLDQVGKLKPVTADVLFTTAELRLQWAFTYLKFGHEFDAAWNIRQAYLTVQECKKKFPEFTAIKKTSGVLEVMLGSVPEKYQWMISLFSMSGSVETGLKELEQVQLENPSLAFETALLYYLTQGFILQQTANATKGFDSLMQQHPENRLALFLGGCVAIKNSESEKALRYFTSLKKLPEGLPLAYASYQLGEVYLHKGEYKLSIAAYKKFLTTYTGKNYVKDAHYKIGISHWLSGHAKEADQYFAKAKITGNESTEADKYAARSLAENSYPNSKLSKIRYATDGGYYAEAEAIALTVLEKDLPSKKEKIEFAYRKARLYHKSGSFAEAKKHYTETITISLNDSWYFAPNACLQLGYIYLDENNQTEARDYFEKALTYKKHEYKNSIDSKAKSALARIKK
jgi:tetratricopeptide (TPR) repeat protein